MKILCACWIAAFAAVRTPEEVLGEIESKLAELKEMLARPRPADMFEKILLAKVTVLEDGLVRVMPMETVDSAPLEPFVVGAIDVSDKIVRV